MSVMKRMARVVTMALLGTLWWGCGGFSIPEARPHRPNVIIVLVDTLRADHMSTYGYTRPTTPYLDTLAETSFVFERARSQAACTFPSVNTLFTSRYAFDYYQLPEGEMGIPDRFPTIAELLHDQGYATAAVSASPIVRVTPSDHNPSAGFGAGFDVFDETCLWDTAACVNLRAQKLLADLEEPFFLYLHYMEPHSYYDPPPDYQRVFAGDYEGHDFIAAGNPVPIEDMLFADGPQLDISDADIQHLVDLYDDEIRYFDSQFQSLAQQLESSDLLDRTVFLFTADHGEEFMEHGQMGHCRGVWDTLTRVPLIIRLPGGGDGARISAPVQLVDVLPTVLDLLQVPSDQLALEGASLRPIFESRDPIGQFAYSDQSRFRAVDDGRWHLILDGVERTSTLYDVVDDPLEQHDRFRAGHPEVDRLGAALNAWLKQTGQWVGFDKALAASKAKEEELRALGYLQ
jgi:arylsulfatase